MPKLRLTNAEKQILGELYAKTPLNRGRLPYTDDFERLYTEFVARSGKALSRNEVWRALENVGKRGSLIRKER